MKARAFLVFLIGVVLFGLYFFYTSYAFIFFTKDHQLLRLTLKKSFFSQPQKEILVEVAKTQASITQGLSNRMEMRSLDGQTIDGLLFVFPNQATRYFWMKEMLFDLDICWLNKSMFMGCQRSAQKNQTLEIYTSPQPVNLVLETQPGFLSDEDLNTKLFFKWR